MKNELSMGTINDKTLNEKGSLYAQPLPDYGVVEGKLSQHDYDQLWETIKLASQKPIDIKKQLAGVISTSLDLIPALKERQKTTPFLSQFLSDAIRMYCTEYGTVRLLGDLETKSRIGWDLISMWVNFQRENEFNPLHDHAGVLSFVIWMRVPYESKDQEKLDIAQRSNSKHDVGNFSFSYSDILGGTRSFLYPMGKDKEGMMVMFPSKLKHQVFPFYNCKEERVSISGNLDIPIKSLVSQIGGLQFFSGGVGDNES